MSRMRRLSLAGFVAATLLLSPAASPPAVAQGLVEAGMALIWEAGKSALPSIVGGFLSAAGASLFGAVTGVFSSSNSASPADVDVIKARLSTVETDLRKSDPKLSGLADEVEKLRGEVKVGMTQQQYYQKALGTLEAMSQRIAELEKTVARIDRNDKDQDKRLKELERRLAVFEQAQRRRIEPAAVQAAEARLNNQGLYRSAQGHLQTARDFARRDDHDRAIIELTEAVQPLMLVRKSVAKERLDTETIDIVSVVLVARGKAYATRGLDPLALADFSTALALEPSDAFRARGLEARGDLLNHLGKPQFARDDYRRALALAPSKRLEDKLARLPESRADSSIDPGPSRNPR